MRKDKVLTSHFLRAAIWRLMFVRLPDRAPQTVEFFNISVQVPVTLASLSVSDSDISYCARTLGRAVLHCDWKRSAISTVAVDTPPEFFALSDPTSV
jgi:hypothetical protein